MEVIEEHFSELREAWEKVQSEYDKYVDITFKGEEEDAKTSRWIKEIVTLYYEAESLKIDYIKKTSEKDGVFGAVDANLNLNIVSKYKSRELEEVTLRSEIENFYKLLKSAKPDVANKKLVSTAYNDIKLQYNRCKDSQAKLIELLSEDDAKLQLDWTRRIPSIHSEVSQQVSHYYSKIENERIETAKEFAGLKLEPMKMTRFSGEIRDYYRF